MQNPPNAIRRGVSLVELMVVLAIIGLMLGMLLPAVQVVRERAREAVCKNNLHQLNMAIANFAETHKKLPAEPVADHVSGWTVEILPFLEQRNRFEKLPVGRTLSSVPEAFRRRPAIFRCPRRTSLDEWNNAEQTNAHYAFVPTRGRKSYYVFDFPLELQAHWLNGPEFRYEAFIQRKGPHADGFFFSSGFQQGVGFMLNGVKQH